MKFLIECIDSNLSAWNPKLNTIEEKYSIVFGVKPISSFRMDIDDNYLLCSDEYYDTHSAELIHRKKVSCSVTILGSKPLNQELVPISSLGYGKLIDEDLNFFIYLNSQAFFHLCNQINSMKKINDLFITFNSQLDDGAYIPSNSENSNKLVWDRSPTRGDSWLEVKSFEFGCNLYQAKDLN